MTDKDVIRYLSLVDRRLEIIVNSGINWKPEYKKELADIDSELKELRILVDLERDKRQGKDSVMSKLAYNRLAIGSEEKSNAKNGHEPAKNHHPELGR